MSIVINQDKCISCKQCKQVCPGSLIKINEKGKAYIAYPRDCWGCVSCVKECRQGAISFYLGADIGGKGSMMNVERNDEVIHWKINSFTGKKIIIDINPKESNKY